MKKFKETKLSGEKVFSGKLLHVYRDKVKLPTGNTSVREHIRHQGAAVVIPFHKRDLLLVKQYRYPIQQAMLELPAGKIDAGEDPFTTIQRELGEETGYTTDKIYELQPIHPCVGYSNEIIHLYLAIDLHKTDLTPDEDETLELVRLPLKQAMEKVYTGEISDSKTIIGLFWVEKLLNDDKLQKRFGIEL